MGQALYRSYRPRRFGEVVGQEHITDTLEKALTNGRISHAYLFTGPRGVGKTSVARILAHAVNDLDYKDESQELDIIEIDAASNRRIDEVREIRERVHAAPSSAKYKVYIIDEVHMLTKEAFNALLKTLEEPPAHVIFILATTEAHKLPETIISRTQRFEFKPIGQEQSAKRLAAIAKKEKIDIEPEALALLAEHGQGSFRDSISLLDQLSAAGDQINEKTVRRFLGLPPARLISELAEAVAACDSSAVLSALDSLKGQGADSNTTARLLSANLRERLIAGAEDWIPPLLRHLSEVAASARPSDSLEIAVLEACTKRQPQQTITTPRAAEPEIQKPAAPAATAKPAIKATAPKAHTTPKAKLSPDDWEEIKQKVKGQAASLYTALRLAEPQLSANELTLAFQFPLHQKKIEQAQHKDLIMKAASEVLGRKVSLRAIVDKTVDKTNKTASKSQKKVELQTISNIFGQPEVLES